LEEMNHRMASCFYQEAAFGGRERFCWRLLSKNEHSSNIETLWSVQGHTYVVPEIGNRTIHYWERFGTFVGREVLNLVHRVVSGFLLERDGFFADTSTMGDLFASVPFGGTNMCIVYFSLVNDREEMLCSFVQKGDCCQVCVKLVHKASKQRRQRRVALRVLATCWWWEGGADLTEAAYLPDSLAVRYVSRSATRLGHFWR
jgi:hypothetical protein